MAQQTDPLASGASTSEGKLTMGAIAVGLVIALVEALQPLFAQASEAQPGQDWYRLGAMACGGAIALASLLGYQKTRSLLKSNAIVQGIAAGIPLVVAALGSAVLKSVPAHLKAAVPAQTEQLAAVPAAPGTLPPLP